MKSIKGKGTKIEVMLAKALWHKGIRYRKNDRSVFGIPDISIKKHKIAIFVDGEFWHGKDWHENRIDTNKDFWNRKIKNNIARDELVNKTLAVQGWTVLRFWENDIVKNMVGCIEKIETVTNWKLAEKLADLKAFIHFEYVMTIFIYGWRCLKGGSGISNLKNVCKLVNIYLNAFFNKE